MVDEAMSGDPLSSEEKEEGHDGVEEGLRR
jgi:hypothetical protein